VPAPTNPRKQSLMPSGPLRKALRAAGHHLSPVVQVGKEGLTAAVVLQLDGALLAHELVKVKAGTESPEGRFELAAAIAALPRTHVAQVIGRTVLVYRKHPKTPRFEAGPPELEVPAVKAKGPRRSPPRRPPPRRKPARRSTK
jgi:RNA-binding protein